MDGFLREGSGTGRTSLVSGASRPYSGYGGYIIGLGKPGCCRPNEKRYPPKAGYGNGEPGDDGRLAGEESGGDVCPQWGLLMIESIKKDRDIVETL